MFGVIALALPAHANEGMWKPDQLPQLSTELTHLGMTMPMEQVTDLSQAPLGAIVDMDFCSGGFVSADGLIATAYHCIGNYLQHASERGENLFETGFYAEERGDERWGGPSAGIKITTSMRDVTDEVYAGTKRQTQSAEERRKRMQSNIKQLVRRCESKVGLHCEVVDFDQGTEFQLVSQIEVQDVRVVYAPPRSVGYFGGDADNFQWPRQSGDFAFLRAYVAPDGKPRAYHPDNVPMTSPAWLPAATGPEPGDFVMVAGYPAGTYRWLTASEIEYAKEEQYPRRMTTDREVIAILERFAEQYPNDAGKVAPRILNINNRIQYLEGNLVAFDTIDAVYRKWQFEQDLERWIVADEQRERKYGLVLDTMHRIQAEEAATAERDHVAKQWQRQGIMFRVAMRLYKLAQESRKRDADRASGYQNRDRNDFSDWLDAVDQRYDWRFDEQVMRYFLLRALALPEGLRIPELDNWFANLPHEGSTEEKIDKELSRLYISHSDLTDPDKRKALMDTTPWFMEKSGNPWFELVAAVHPFFERLNRDEGRRDTEWQEVRPQYMAAIKQFIPQARPRAFGETLEPGLFYPDANSTLRITVGKVDGYFPKDGLIASPRTRLQGIAEKAGEEPFDAPEALMLAIESEKWGPYGDESLRSVSVNYLSTCDTTLGSSGSVSISADGKFIGVLFDGNYESMATDWMFEESITRSIHTDSSYILWYLDRVAKADGLLKELGFEPALPGMDEPQIMAEGDEKPAEGEGEGDGEDKEPVDDEPVDDKKPDDEKKEK